MKTYEAMFLLDPALASDFPAAEGEVRRILDRAEAEVLGLVKWDERKLAYPIRNHKRGLYILSYFKAESSRISDLERDVRLSETVIRALVLSKDGMTAEDIEKVLASTPATEKPASRSDDGGPRRDRERPVGKAAEPAKATPEPAKVAPEPANSAPEAESATSATAVAEATDEDKTESGS